ncbi:hypothetical protein ACVWZZ_007768 [Bradyrhizobium sp. LM6.10]
MSLAPYRGHHGVFRIAYFHAQFRRTNPLPYKEVYTILEGISGRGHYVRTYMAWGVNNNGWWGEGEIKFFVDGDGEFPTICGTGTEDYICGAYNFDPYVAHSGQGPAQQSRYQEFTTPYAGLPQVIRPDGVYKSQQRFGMYRWHIPDPVRFRSDLRVTIQALGWLPGIKKAKYLPLQDDIASVAFWYQTLPPAPFPERPDPISKSASRPSLRSQEQRHPDVMSIVRVAFALRLFSAGLLRVTALQRRPTRNTGDRLAQVSARRSTTAPGAPRHSPSPSG